MIKLIASDLDGTLLDEKGRLPEGIFDLILSLRQRGIRFAAASGRQYGNLKRLFAPVSREMDFVCENGGLVVADGQMEPVFFPRETAEGIIRDILSAGCELLISAPETCYLLASASRAYTDDMVYRLRNTCTVLEDPFLYADGYIKISAFSPDGMGDWAQTMREKWQGRAHADLASARWLDFTWTNKGGGLTRLCEKLNIQLADVAAFGDQFNDVSMLEIVGRPYLMAHAPEALRRRGFAPCVRVMDTLREIAGE